ncbi:MAG: NAD-dependent epimerase/dehydratase family protein [Ottowia sp.]|nr:NAD-dependent epimerase/dehydratase family protein [Ottowia sp.]
MHNRIVGLLGASSLVGKALLTHQTTQHWHITAFSRQAQTHTPAPHIAWQSCSVDIKTINKIIPDWLCVAPIWVLPDYFDLLKAYGLKRIVVLSSTSRFTKHASSDLEEQAVAQKLIQAETALQQWADTQHIEWIILRPTLIYDFIHDKNIAHIAHFIKRFGFFPLFGKAHGLRQPIHVQDVAQACIAALNSHTQTHHAYNLSGGETLSYREMVLRVFSILHRPPRLVSVPLFVFRLALIPLRLLPRYRHWSVAMAERMNRDLVFDHSQATQALHFSPRSFGIDATDKNELNN